MMKDDLNLEHEPEREPKRETRADLSSEARVATSLQALDELLDGSALLHSDEAQSERAAETAAACPGPGDWLDLAIGSLAAEKRWALLSHASGCGACAGRLRQGLRIMAEEASAEESASAARFASATRDWQRRLAAELAGTPHRSGRSRLLEWPVWAGAGLAASLALAAGLVMWWQHVNTPEQLLAEAYSHSRTFDLRMPGADYAAVTPESHLRGTATARESSKLLEARARIENRLEKAPEDAHWLQLEARADLLEEKFDPAIDILDRLVAAGPVTSSLLADDAAAYFQRGSATGSENDRATALDYLRRADELTPSDPVVLFNEAVAMENRGEVMNAVETWNRYLRFERDPRWLAEGRRRLESLEQRLNRLKTHQSRMENDLATPQAMLALAGAPASLAAVDEELTSTMLPKLLDSAFVLPVDRSRGSPCGDKCQAARTLLHLLATSLEAHHRDPWLFQFLPAATSSPSPKFNAAAQALARSIDADQAGDYLAGKKSAEEARRRFQLIGNAAGEDRAQLEVSFAAARSSDHPGCYAAVHPLLQRNPQFAWIQIFAFMQNNLCDSSPGTAGENDPRFLHATEMAHERGYTLLELRARNLLGAAAIDNGDAEASWRIYLPSVRIFYSGDYPPQRLYTILSGLEEAEQSTPRVQHTLLLQREVVGVLQLTPARQILPTERFKLASVAIRAGSVTEAQAQLRQAQKELAANGGGESVKGYLAEAEMAMANLYLERRDLTAAAGMLEAAEGHIAGGRNSYHTREFAAAQGQLELAEGHPEAVESLLRDALVEEEHLTLKGGAESITLAQQGRDLYSVLAAVWLAQGRPAEDVLALWERYRLRILGKPVPPCPDKGLACLRPSLSMALGRLGHDRVFGQIVLLDRTLLYRANVEGVTWASIPIGKQDILDAEAALERVTSSPVTSQDTVDQAARRVGGLLFGGLERSTEGQLLVESDPLLGNLPWPAVETSDGPLGLRYDLTQAPSLLLASNSSSTSRAESAAAPLIVGASIAAGEHKPLPEVMDESQAVARFERDPKLLLAGQATEAQVTAHLEQAAAVHFAGHAVVEGGVTRLLLAPSTGTAAGSSGAADKPYLDSDILRRHPPRLARLAVFSACTTGKKEEGWNHGMGDIVDTLAALGVPEVVATRWQIDSASAVPVMDSFYSGLAQGFSVSHALTAARQSLVRDARYRHPYYWAAYYSSGMGRPNLNGIFQINKQLNF